MTCDGIRHIKDFGIEELQKLIDDMKTVPQFAGYIKAHKVSLIDSGLGMIDQYLDAGILKD
jgi:purine-nucleoside phosphorylase